MKTIVLLFFCCMASGSYAQPYRDYDVDIPFDENVLHKLQQHHVRKLAFSSDTLSPFYIEEWEFSTTGKLTAFRLFQHNSDETDPYPTLPETVMQAPQDTIYTYLTDSTKRAQCVNYHFFNTYGIWRRSFYYPGHRDEYRHYNEMQYAFDADSNLIYYRSNMDYVRPTTLHTLEWLIRYDTLGNITERVRYDSGIYEWSANWYPQFDTARYESITYNFDTGEATHTRWEKHSGVDYHRSPCDHCVGNRGEVHIETLPIEEHYVRPAVEPFEYPLSRKEARRRRRHPPPAVLFEGNRAVINRHEYAVTYW